MIRRILLLGTTLLLLGAGAVGLAAWWAWDDLHRPRGGSTEVRVTIESGMSAAAILHRLEDAGVVARAELARLWLIHRMGDPSLKAGEYVFSTPRTTPEVLAMLVRGEVETHPMTLIEGLTLEESAASIADQGFGRLETLLAAMRDPALVRDLDPEAPHLEGYLHPDTYSFARGTSEDEIVATLVRTFRSRWEREIAPAVDPGTRLRDLVTLASIVEKEARLDDERPVIASVYANRLRRGIALYADPTVIYGLKEEGTWDGNLRKADLRHDTPWNTYLHAGLPPGPICSPGLASLLAAAAPASTDYLYFVSRNDGSHVFARTLSEHNRNVAKWQKRYWREKWAAERARASGDSPSR